MEIVNQQNEIENLSENFIYGWPELNNSRIQFIGKGNVLYCDENISINNSFIKFSGNNAIIFLASSRYEYCLNVVIYNNSVLYFGKNNFINQKLNVIVSEQQNIIIGDDCIISFGCWIRTADAHLIYDSVTQKRINNSKGILIGDHVWIGQQALILKGSEIGSGSIVGAASVVANKQILSNCIYGGNPVKKIKENVFFCNESVHMFLNDNIKTSQKYESSEYVYDNESSERMTFDYINNSLNKMEGVSEKIQYIKEVLVKNDKKNRFSV